MTDDQQGARVARYAEAIQACYDLDTEVSVQEWDERVARAFMAMADQETAELRAEVMRLRTSLGHADVREDALRSAGNEWMRRAEAAEAKLSDPWDMDGNAAAQAWRKAAEAESARLASVVAKVEALADEWEQWARDDFASALQSPAPREVRREAYCWSEASQNLREALVSVGVSGSADDRREANASQAPDTATPGEAREPETDWQGLLSMVWTGDTTYPFMEDENANITGYGHQDKAAFASAINAYDEDCNGGPIPEDDQWSADSIAHQWVLPDADDDERLHPVAEGTPDAIPVTTLWGAR